jgi:hypothetical protein
MDIHMDIHMYMHMYICVGSFQAEHARNERHERG